MNTRNSKSNGINAYADQSAIPKKESVNMFNFNQMGSSMVVLYEPPRLEVSLTQKLVKH